MKSPAEAVVRDAVDADNEALVRLSVACPMEGDIGLAVDRAPDFFVLNRLEGERWRVGVVEGPQADPVGCIAVAQRTVYLDGRPATSMYVSDLKVHPDFRGGDIADALTRWARDVCIEMSGPDVLLFFTVLAGNRSVQRRMAGPRGLPGAEVVATFQTQSVSLLWHRRPSGAGVTVRPAQAADLEEMAELWARLAPMHQFAHTFTATSLAAWIDAAPALDLSSYSVARWSDGGLAGFMGAWDQSSFKRLRVTGYSRRLAAARAAFNVVAPFVGATRLPPPGAALHNLTAIHVCVPPEEPGVLRALVLDTYNRARGKGYSFLNVGLAEADPLMAGLRGLWPQRTDIWLCAAYPDGRSVAGALDGKAVHHEIALV